MALANIPMLLSLVLALCGVCFGAIYQVGDSKGWTDRGVDYEIWASTKNFTVGDVLHFKYDRKENNVVRVFHKAFRSCHPKHGIYRMRTGDDYIRLNRPGNFFFICSVNGHCRSGQKVHVSVSRSVPSVSPGTPGIAPTLSPVPSRRSTSPTLRPIGSPTSPTATPTATPRAAPTDAAPAAVPRASPTPDGAPSAAPTTPPMAEMTAAPTASPISAPRAAPTAAPKSSPTPKGAPAAAPTTSPMADGPSSSYSPPALPLELIPAPKAAPPDQSKKSSAQSIHSSMPFLMAIGFIACILI